MDKGLAKKCDIYAYCIVLEGGLSTGQISYLDHATECLRCQEIVACPLKESASDIATKPHLPARFGLKGRIDAVDTVSCFLNLEMLPLKHGNTRARESTLE